MPDVLFCPNCGKTKAGIVTSGRFGCANCALVFPEFLPRSQIPINQLELEKFLNQTGSPEIRRNMKEIMDGNLIPDGIFRIRLARNTATFFENDAIVKEEIRKNLMNTLATIPGVVFENPALGEWRAYFFDEDHLRMEKFFQGSCIINTKVQDFLDSGIFSYVPKKGYILSCPTNSIRGNKISVVRKLSGNFLANHFLKFQKIFPFLEFKDESGRGFLDKNGSTVNIFAKNFNNYRKNLFYSAIYLLQEMEGENNL